MKKSLIRQLKSEDWVIVGAGAAILLLALLFPRWMPAMPKDLSSAGNWMSAGAMFLFLLVLTGVCQRILGRPLRRFAVSLLAIFGVALLSQAVASIPAIKRLGFEAVFFSVIFGLVISNFFRVPEWLKPAIQSEFYIKIGIVCLGATILFGEVLQSGVYALIQAFIVVFYGVVLRLLAGPADACGRGNLDDARQLGQHLRRFGRHRHLRRNPGATTRNSPTSFRWCWSAPCR